MVWHQVKAEVTKPHVAYAVTGFALVFFGTISLFLKEKLYIGEATVATIYGLIVGPHCLNWFAPTTWGNSDYITIEISRIVLIVQIFAVAVELPKKYMLRHWWSIAVLLLPVMTYGWVLSSAFIWKLVPTLRWIEALCISGCITATDPVLAAAVVGKGKFAKRVPGHLRNLLSAESGCNDGMAFPFVIMAIDILEDEKNTNAIAVNFICVGVLYSCVVGILMGVVIGYLARHLIKFAEKNNLIDRENFLVYYFCVALFCAGVGTLCGVDDLLVAFGAGAAFSWDGWFAKQTKESHVSEVIDSLLNTAFFVYFGAIVPWPEFNNGALGISAWKLTILAIILLVVRRLPIILALKPIIPDIHTWREALFCGHFGPIGVGAVFMSLLARAQLESNSETPLAEIPRDHPNYFLIATIWPISCFLVISSIIVHGSSIAVFTLGKRINNMAVTLTYTTGGNEPSWLSRLPRRNSDAGNILQLQRLETEEPIDKKLLKKKLKKLKKQSKVVPEEKHENEFVGLKLSVEFADRGRIMQLANIPAKDIEGKHLKDIKTFQEGPHIIVEDNNGVVIHTFDVGPGTIEGHPSLEIVASEEDAENAVPKEAPKPSLQRPRSRNLSRTNSEKPGRRGQHAYAYQIDDNVVVENNEGDILRRYKYVRRGSSPRRTMFQKIKHAIPRFLSSSSTKTNFRESDESSSDKSFKDVEHAPENTLVPDESALGDLKKMSPEDEEELQHQLTQKIEHGELSDRRTPVTTHMPLGGNSEQYLNNVFGTDGTTEDDDDDYDTGLDDDEEPETEVERHRRLAALGITSTNSRRNSSFSEGIPEADEGEDDDDDDDGDDNENGGGDANDNVNNSDTDNVHEGDDEHNSQDIHGEHGLSSPKLRKGKRSSSNTKARENSDSNNGGDLRSSLAALRLSAPSNPPEIAVVDADEEDGDNRTSKAGNDSSQFSEDTDASSLRRPTLHRSFPSDASSYSPPQRRPSRDEPRITFKLPEHPRDK